MDLVAVGEMVVDFLPAKEEGTYIRKAGGAPANVAVGVSRLGFKCAFCGKVGKDSFGAYLWKILEKNNVQIVSREQSEKAITTMAFVTLEENGERSFTFARKPGADMFLNIRDIKKIDFANCRILHSGSCSLSAEPSATATYAALKFAKENKVINSFDINYRDFLWENNLKLAKAKIEEALAYVDLLKLSSEEKELIFPGMDIKEIKDKFNLLLVVETMGELGSRASYRDHEIFEASQKVKCIDATGAGDAFWSGFLAGILQDADSIREDINLKMIKMALRMGNISGALTVQKKGAMDALPTRDQLIAHL